MRGFVRSVLALASVAVFAPAMVGAQARPVIAVMYFDNNSIGRDRADFEGVGRGIADMLITDMASNPTIRVVEREQIQALLTEQNLTKAGTIDPQTAIRLGKIIGAQYMITGGFMSDGRGTYVLTARAINVETSGITNPIRLTSKGDDVLGLIAQLSTKLNTDMKLPALQVGQAGAAAATPAGTPAAAVAAAPAQHAQAAEAPPAAKPAARPAEARPAAKPATQVAQAKKPVQRDIRTAMLYSKALEQEDAGNRTAAVELYRQVVAKFPEYTPAQNKISTLSRR
ncbi:MAG TPA: CsgG/HfaB family protein [Gemmatimonadaceae bacterium]|nr:CsgG/HfaB family protein [Gemmatimonadaceae bacterium]